MMVSSAGETTARTTQSIKENCACLFFMGVWKRNKSPASFTFDADRTFRWTTTVLKSNLSYYRVRRELFATFITLMDAAVIRAVIIDEEEFIAIKQFLTLKNDALSDDKRLSFDKAIMALRSASQPIPPP